MTNHSRLYVRSTSDAKTATRATTTPARPTSHAATSTAATNGGGSRNDYNRWTTRTG